MVRASVPKVSAALRIPPTLWRQTRTVQSLSAWTQWWDAATATPAAISIPLCTSKPISRLHSLGLARYAKLSLFSSLNLSLFLFLTWPCLVYALFLIKKTLLVSVYFRFGFVTFVAVCSMSLDRRSNINKKRYKSVLRQFSIENCASLYVTVANERLRTILVDGNPPPRPLPSLAGSGRRDQRVTNQILAWHGSSKNESVPFGTCETWLHSF